MSNDAPVRGRPRLAEEDKRTRNVRIYMTDREFAGLLAMRKEGEKPGATAHRLLFEAPDPQ